MLEVIAVFCSNPATTNDTLRTTHFAAADAHYLRLGGDLCGLAFTSYH